MNHRIIRVFLGVVIIAAAVGGVVYWEWPGVPRLTVAPPPAGAVPTMNWAPTSVTQIIASGESKTISVSFVASETVSNVVVRIVPELQPFIQVRPAAFGSIVQGQTININITISAASSSPLGRFAGTIQLSSGIDPMKTFAKPLPVTVELWQRIISLETGISLRLPDFGQPARFVAGPSIGLSTFLEVEVLNSSQDRFVSEFGFEVTRNEENLTLEDWFNRNVDRSGVLLASGAFRGERLTSGMEILSLTGPIPPDYSGEPVGIYYAISPSRRTIVAVFQPQENDLALYGYGRTAQVLLLRRVLENAELP